MVFQHFNLFDTITVAENVWLGLDKGMFLGAGERAHCRKGRRVRPRH